MRVVVIGSTGHTGGYLVPRLVAAGHEVVAISRGRQQPYRVDPAWSAVRRIVADRDAEDAEGVFGARIAALAPDVVVDMVCFTPGSASAMLGALRGTGARLLVCGSIWAHGALTAVPAREDEDRHPWGEYGIGKAAIEDVVLAEAGRADGVPSAVLHPGHISGPGWPVIGPAGNLDPGVWQRLAAGRSVLLPNLGLETLHHVHADDLAQAFARAVERPDADGRAYHVCSDRAMTLRGLAESAAAWWGRSARIEYAPLDEFVRRAGDEHGGTTRDHVQRSSSVSIDAARTGLGYAPSFSSLAAVREAVDALAARPGSGIPAPTEPLAAV